MTPEDGKSKGAISHFFHAFRWSMKGLGAALRTETAFRQEVVAAMILWPASAFLPVTVERKLLLAAVVALVLIVELLNSSIEAVVDMVSPGYHELAGKAKDCGSAAVFLTLVLAGAVWAVTAWELVFR